jgi:hypothetical protein
MVTVYQKRKIERVLFSWWTIALLFVVVCAMTIVSFRAYRHGELAHDRRTAVEVEKSEQEMRLEVLAEEIALFEDARGIEEVVRERYAVGREGETVVVFLAEEEDEEGAGGEVVDDEPTWWQKIYSWL